MDCHEKSCLKSKPKTEGKPVKFTFKSKEKAVARHDIVMRLLVRRYVTAEQRKTEEFGITEDDVMEIRQDISSMKFEMIDIFKQNGYKTPKKDHDPNVAQGKKGRVMERRLLKDFQIGLVEGLVQDAITSAEKGGPKDMFSKIARAIGRKASQGSKKKDWNAVARQRSVARDPIGSTAEGADRRRRQSVRRYILDHQKDGLSSMDVDKLVEYNPRLADIAPAARVAYAKFKIPKIKQEYEANTEQQQQQQQQQQSAGPNDVFENAPTVDVVDETTNKSGPSIARPRPKSTRKSAPVAGALPFPVAGTSGAPLQKPKTDSAEDVVAKARAPAPEDQPGDAADGENSKTAETTAGGGEGPKGTGSGETESAGEDGKIADDDKDKGKDKDKDNVKDKDKDDGKDKNKDDGKDKNKDDGKDKDKDEGKDKGKGEGKDKEKGEDRKGADKGLLKPESPKRSVSPRKQGGKSKVTGEILTGWL